MKNISYRILIPSVILALALAAAALGVAINLSTGSLKTAVVHEGGDERGFYFAAPLGLPSKSAALPAYKNYPVGRSLSISRPTIRKRVRFFRSGASSSVPLLKARSPSGINSNPVTSVGLDALVKRIADISNDLFVVSRKLNLLVRERGLRK